MRKEDIQRTFVDTDPAEVASFGIDPIDSVFLQDGLTRTDLLATTALVADMDFERSRFWKPSADVNGRLLRVIVSKFGYGADHFTECTSCAFDIV